MTRLAGLVLLSALAVPAAASHPTQARQERPRPTQSAEPPLAPPVAIPPAPELPRVGGNRPANATDAPGSAREPFHRFWMNDRPRVLPFQRPNGAAGP